MPVMTAGVTGVMKMIEREQLVKLIQEAIKLHDGICRVVGRKQMKKIADYLLDKGVTFPVRCKDCKHWLKDVPGCTDAIGRCRFGNYMVGANGYCVYGERKDND